MTEERRCTCDIWPQIRNEFRWYARSDGTEIVKGKVEE